MLLDTVFSRGRFAIEVVLQSRSFRSRPFCSQRSFQCVLNIVSYWKPGVFLSGRILKIHQVGSRYHDIWLESSTSELSSFLSPAGIFLLAASFEVFISSSSAAPSHYSSILETTTTLAPSHVHRIVFYYFPHHQTRNLTAISTAAAPQSSP